MAAALGSSSVHAQTLENRERAVELFKSSQDAYRSGRFQDAANALEEAYRLDPNPILLYNLARARESVGQLVLAREAYQRYLDEAPEAEDRTSVAARIEALERQIAEKARLQELVEEERRAKEQAAQAAESARLAAQEREGGGIGPGPWVLVGTGLATLGAGAVLGVLANDQNRSARAEIEQLRASQLASQAEDLALGANIAYVAGSVLTLSGIVWAVAHASGDKEPSDASVSIGPGGLWVTGRF